MGESPKESFLWWKLGARSPRSRLGPRGGRVIQKRRASTPLCVLGGFARNILRGRVSRKGAKDAKEVIE